MFLYIRNQVINAITDERIKVKTQIMIIKGQEMMILGIINYYYNSKGKDRRRNNEGGEAVALTHHYSPSS